MKKILIYILCLSFPICSIADEGMWIPMLLKKYNEADMQAKGFKLTADDIYSINKASIKDAIVLFGGGCTAEIVSDKGLIFTNHHCGYSTIQSHSSVENDYLKNGFWAMKQQDELQNKGLTASLLVRMEDVTQKVLTGVKDNMNETDRQAIIKDNIKKLKTESIKGSHYQASIKPFFLW